MSQPGESLAMSDYDYYLPSELIAQTAAEPRDAARLMVLDRRANTITHRPGFRNILDYLLPGDTLVVNESKVIPARIYGRKLPSGGKVELLLLRPAPPERQPTCQLQPPGEALVWEALVRPGRGMKQGARLELGLMEERLEATVAGESPSHGRYIRFSRPPLPFLERNGELPLPPYIHRQPVDPNRYQTVYANPQAQGSAAAPTAGLHFTPELIQDLNETGISFERVQLHVGLDTFQPVKEENALEHTMHSEWCALDTATAGRLNTARSGGGRIVAVGTTAVRTLETAFDGHTGQLEPYEGDTRLFLYPGKPLKAVDALITNFHLPRSTLLLLVSAFAGQELIARAYQQAISEGYRFFSFGDAMLII